MATHIVNPWDKIIELRLQIYAQNHSSKARDLAEVIDFATNDRGVSLNDDECELTLIFREAIELYAKKHRIPMQAVGAALLEWQAIEQ